MRTSRTPRSKHMIARRVLVRFLPGGTGTSECKDAQDDDERDALELELHGSPWIAGMGFAYNCALPLNGECCHTPVSSSPPAEDAAMSSNLASAFASSACSFTCSKCKHSMYNLAHALA